ncbi:hypothetical protein CCP3SC15_380001 [Gammaproteobacteria bacterium]
MAKRFTATEKWNDPWFSDLSDKEKLFWIYLLDNCNHAGIWDVNWRLIKFHIAGFFYKAESFKDRIYEISESKWFIPKFIDFQYGELNPENRVHSSIIMIHQKEGVCKPLISPLQGAKDKDKDQDKEKDQVKDKEGGVGETGWREDYATYEKECESAFDSFAANPAWMIQRQEFYPHLDIYQSMKKAFVEFWGTRAGWEHKKKKHVKTIDWEKTILNAISMKSNQVYKVKTKDGAYAR